MASPATEGGPEQPRCVTIMMPYTVRMFAREEHNNISSETRRS